jgi:hypothetical protein
MKSLIKGYGRGKRLGTAALDSRLGCEARMPAVLYPQKSSGTLSRYKLSKPRSHGAAGRIRCTEKISDSIRNPTRDHPACVIAPQPSMLQLIL